MKLILISLPSFLFFISAVISCKCYRYNRSNSESSININAININLYRYQYKTSVKSSYIRNIPSSKKEFICETTVCSASLAVAVTVYSPGMAKLFCMEVLTLGTVGVEPSPKSKEKVIDDGPTFQETLKVPTCPTCKQDCNTV